MHHRRSVQGNILLVCDGRVGDGTVGDRGGEDGWSTGMVFIPAHTEEGA